MKAEVITSKTYKQHAHKNKSQPKERGKKLNCTNSQAMKGHSLHNITPHVSPEMVPGLAFVLYRHVNLNKERNKRARCLRVDALASNAPLPHLADERRGGTETTEAQCLEVV